MTFRDAVPRNGNVLYQIDEEAAPLPQQPRGRQALLVARSTNGVVAGLSTPAWLPPCCSPLFDFSPARDHLNDRSTVGGLQVGRKLRKVPTFGREIGKHLKEHPRIFLKPRGDVLREESHV